MDIYGLLSNLATLQPQPATGSTSPVRTKTPLPTVEPTPMHSRSIKLSLTVREVIWIQQLFLCWLPLVCCVCDCITNLNVNKDCRSCMGHIPLGTPKISYNVVQAALTQVSKFNTSSWLSAVARKGLPVYLTTELRPFMNDCVLADAEMLCL